MVRRVFVSFGIALLCVSAAFAANTGRLAGQVLDNDGVALPGVTVQISSANLIGGPQSAVSGVEGEFAFNLLPPGDYTVEAILPGFRPQTGDVRVQADATASVTFRMVPESFSSEIEVLAEVPVVDTSQVNARQVWDEDYLQNALVGTANRGYQSVLSQAAGVTGGSNPNVFGSTEGENAYLIDGMNTTDTVTGTWATMFNMDAVEEMNFQTGGFEAEFGQATGGIVNLVTKSGGNEFSGSLDVRYRGDNMTESGDHFDPDEEMSEREQYSGALGGPILRDKLWFFTSLQYIKSISDEPTWYFPYNWEGWQFLGKATWQVSDGNRLVGKFSTDPAEIPGVNAGINATETAKGTQEQGGDIWQFELNSVLSASWLLNAQLGTSNGFIKVYSTDYPDTVSAHYNEQTLLWYSGYPYNVNDKRPRDEARVNASWFVDDLLGSHEFKGGLEYTEMAFESGTYNNGGAIFYDNNGNAGTTWDPIDLNGDGFFNNYIEVKIPEATAKQSVRTSAEMFTFFLQDSWRVHPNVTVKPGIRLDQHPDVQRPRRGDRRHGPLAASRGRGVGHHRQRQSCAPDIGGPLHGPDDPQHRELRLRGADRELHRVRHARVLLQRVARQLVHGRGPAGEPAGPGLRLDRLGRPDDDRDQQPGRDLVVAGLDPDRVRPRRADGAVLGSAHPRLRDAARAPGRDGGHLRRQGERGSHRGHLHRQHLGLRAG